MGQNEITLKIKVEQDGSFKVVAKNADKAAKSVDNLSKSTKELNRTRKGFHKQEKGIAGLGANGTKNFAKQAQTIGGGSSGLVAAYATLAANVFAVTAAFGALKRAAAFEQLEAGLVRVGNASGQNLPMLADRLRDITDAAISTKEAMTSVALGTSAGFSTAQMEGLTKVAKGASLALGRDMTDAMSRLVRGAAKLEPEILDELGIMVRLDKATKDYAQTLGKGVNELTQFERRMAFTNAIIEQGEKKFGDIAGAIDANPYDKLSATFEDLTQTIIEFVNMGLKPLVSLLSVSPVALGGALTLFSTAIISKVIPSLTQMAASSAAAAAESAGAWQVSFAKTQAAATTLVATLSSGLGSFKFAPKSVKSLETQLKSGKLAAKDYGVAIKKLKIAEDRRQANINNGGTSRKKWDDIALAAKKRELVAIKALRVEILALQAAEANRATIAAKGAKVSQVQRGKSVTSKLTATGLDAMQGKGLKDSFKIAQKRSGAAMKVFAQTAGVVDKFKVGMGAASTATKLFGSTLLKAIPYLGWALMAYQSLTLAMDAFGISFSNTNETTDKVVEGFQSFDGVSDQLAGSLAVTTDASDRYLLTLSATIGVLDQIEGGILAVASIELDDLKKGIGAINAEINALARTIKEAGEAAEKSGFFGKMWNELVAGHAKLAKIELESKLKKTEEGLDKVAISADQVTIALDEAQKQLANSPNLDTSLTNAYLASVKAVNEQFKGKTGEENVLKYKSAIALLNDKLKAGEAAIRAGAGAWSEVTKAQDAYFKKSDGPLDSIIGKWQVLQDNFVSVQGLGNKLANAQFAKGMDIEPENILAHIAHLREAQTIIVGATAKANVYKSEMQNLRGTMKSNAADATAFFEAEKNRQFTIIEKLQTELSLLEDREGVEDRRKVIIDKIVTALGGITAEEEAQRRIASATLVEQKAILDAQTAVLDNKSKHLTLENDILKAIGDQAAIQSEMAAEAAITASFLGGQGGAISAQKELDLFNEQKQLRAQLLEQEQVIKSSLIDMEYALLTQRIIVAQKEAEIKASQIKDPEDRKAAVAAIPDMSRYLKNLQKAKKLAKETSKASFDLKKIKNFNKELKLTAKVSAEFYDKLKDASSILTEDGFSAIFQSTVGAIEGFSAIYDARATMEQDITDLHQEALDEQQKANEAYNKKDYKASEKHIANRQAALVQAASKQNALTEGSAKSQLAMGATVANGMGGILEGLAAAQDTSSKKGFESAKMMQMGATVVNTAGGIMAAMANPGGPQGQVLAATVAAMGAIQLATIASTSFGGGGGAAPSMSGGGAGSSTAGATGPRSTSTRREGGKSVSDSISTKAIRGLATASEDASLAVNKVADGFTSLDSIFDSARSSVKFLSATIEDIANSFSRKTSLGFELGEDNVSLVQTRGSVEVADKLFQPLEEVMADMVKDASNAAIGVGLDIDLDAMSETSGFWSKRMGSLTAEGLEAFLGEYGNAIAATIEGLPDMKNWRFGDFNELMGLVGNLQTINEVFSDVGISAVTSSLDGADSARVFVEAMGGIENVTEAMELYTEVILTDSEQLALTITNSSDRIDTQFAKMNAVIDDSAIPELAGFDIEKPSSKAEFDELFKFVKSWIEDDVYGGVASTVLAGLSNSLPNFQAYWDSIEEEGEASQEALNEKRQWEIELMEAQGFSHQALIASRELEILTVDDEYKGIQRLIWAQEDLNKTRGLEMTLLRALGREESAVAAERADALRALSPGDAVIQSNIWKLEDAKKDVDDARSIYETALANERSSLESAAAAAKASLENLEQMLRDAFAREQEKVAAEYDKQLERLNARLTAASEKVSILSSAFDELESASDSLTSLTRDSFMVAVNGIRDLDKAVAGGDISGLENLSDFTKDITKDTQQFYSTRAEYLLDQTKAKQALESLKGKVGTQLSTEEKTVAALEGQIVATEAAKVASLEALDKQLDALLGINDTTISLEEAIRLYTESEARNALIIAQNQLSALDSLVVFGSKTETATISVATALENLNGFLAVEAGLVDNIEGTFVGGTTQLDKMVEMFDNDKGFATWGAASLQFAQDEEARSAAKTALDSTYQKAALEASELMNESVVGFKNDATTYAYAQDEKNTIQHGEITVELSNQSTQLAAIVTELKSLKAQLKDTQDQLVEDSADMKIVIDNWEGAGLPNYRDADTTPVKVTVVP